MSRAAARAPLLSVALLSAAVLACEVLLVRLFSIVQWHHFAHMAIGIALLGFAVSGTFLALLPRLAERFGATYVVNLLLFGASVLPCFLLAQRFAVHPEALLFDPSAVLGVAVVYLLLALPFFFAGNAVGLALMRFRETAARVYAADLLGAGAGAMGVVALLHLLMPLAALHAVGLVALAAAVTAAAELHLERARFAALLAAAVLAGLLPAALPPSFTALAMSPYKPLSQQMQVMGAAVEVERSGPLGLLTVVASPLVPLRHAPGLALGSTAVIPEQRGVFVDGDGPLTIDAWHGAGDAAWRDDLLSAMPWQLGEPRRRVLVLGAGGGGAVRQALRHGADTVTAVELDAGLVRLVRDDYGDFTGDLYRQPAVRVVVSEARAFVERDTRLYDLVVVPRAGSLGASAAGLQALAEGYPYTVEALVDYHARLAEGGYLVLESWIRLPPRDSLKLFATAVAALRRAGVADPGAHLLLARGWQGSVLLVRRGPFGKGEIAAARRFCEARGFDLAWYAGMPAGEANRHNVLPRPWLHEGARALLGEDAGAWLEAYKFDLRPATDDRPFFGHFFRWRSLPEILELGGRGGRPLLESGYLLLVATLLQALLLGAVLVVLPLHRRLRDATLHGGRMACYFTLLGLAFLMVELAFIQKFLQFLHQPVLAVSASLAGFLVFAGLGSRLADRLRLRQAPGHLLWLAVLATSALAVLYVLALPALVFTPLAAAPLPLKVAVSVLLVGLLALPMGMPFPLGLARLATRAPRQIPVAWALNGCASVVSAVLAGLLAVHLGFTGVVLVAACLYLAAGAVFRF